METVAYLVLAAALATASPSEAQGLSNAALRQLIAQCAPGVHPQTMLAVVKHESDGNPFAINVNKVNVADPKPATRSEAVSAATRLIAQGYNIDMGLGQVNSAHLRRLKLSVAQAFDPCTNLQVAAAILTDNYQREQGRDRPQQAALNAALSRYNTGSPSKGLANGYVGKVRATAYAVPALAPPPIEPQASVMQSSAESEGPPPAWDVYGSARYTREQPKAEPGNFPAESPNDITGGQPSVVFESRVPREQ